MSLFGEHLTAGSAIFLLVALGLALSFEFVNGFHDTANAVATVIYTHSLKPNIAVVYSGCWNLIGVLMSGTGVAFGVVALLPVEMVLNVGSNSGFAMVFALLFAAILWNLGTWYFGLPASSSHALIGSIMGVGLANSILVPGHRIGEGVNWAKATEVGTALIISPLAGFGGAALLLLLLKAVVKNRDLYRAPESGQPPPFWIRCVLILTCTGVSYGHGSNDGQKGMGLIMLILIGIMPVTFAVDLGASRQSIEELASLTHTISTQMDRHAPGGVPASHQAAVELTAYLETKGKASARTFAAIDSECREIAGLLNARASLTELTPDQRKTLRRDLYLTSEAFAKLDRQKLLGDAAEQSSAADLEARMDKLTKFIPLWVKIAVAIALGFGTMIGWKRIVVTVGEKIGKTHLSYAQGAAAELVAAATIIAADRLHLPVSTTHVLSSGVAGTMAANQSGLQMTTLRNLLLAWVLTLPVTVLLGAGIFAFVLNVVIRGF